MTGDEQTTNDSKRRVPWLLLLIVVLLSLLLWWWWTRVRTPIKVAEPIATEPVAIRENDTDAKSVPSTDESELQNAAMAGHRRVRAAKFGIQIGGRVVLVGEPPAERLLLVQRNNDGSESKTFSRDFEVSVSGGLANAFVYVEKGLENASFGTPTKVIRLTGTNHFLEPYVMGVQVDQMIHLENLEDAHSFHVTSSGGAKFTWERNVDGSVPDPLELTFGAPEIFAQVSSSIQQWSWAYIAVVEHPYFAVTDRNGYFKLPAGIAPGNYTITVRHPKAGKATQVLAVMNDGKYNLSFRLNVPKLGSNLRASTSLLPEGETADDGEGLSGIGESARSDGFSVGAPILGNTTIEPGTIRGQVRLRGTPPQERALDVLQRDINCGKLVAGETPLTRFYVTGEKNGLADTVVYIESESLSERTFPSRTEPLLIDQVNCQYAPYVAAVQTGQPIMVRNSDPVFHNVHTTPTASGNRESNKAQMPKTPDLTFVFEKPESFLRFKCDVHPWMFSYVSVFDHPFFAVTDAAGNFSITNVPPGRYTLHASHRKAGIVSSQIVVPDHRGSEVELVMTAK